MPKKDPISDEDKALFRESVKGIRRMDQANTITTKRSLTSKIQPSYPKQEDAAIQPDWSDGTENEFVESDTLLSYKKSGVSERDMRDLRTGKFSIHATLDLHGCTVNTARAALHQFIMHNSVAQRRCVCIIHGKGQRGSNYSVLKSKVNIWLRQSEHVIAFASAPANLGGAGALLVLLK